jgi:signal transduction histidine kinase
MFFAIFQAFLLYLFFKVFPEVDYNLSKKVKYILIPLVILTSLVTLSNFLFPGIVSEIKAGQVAVVSKGPGLILFGIVSVGLVLSGIYELIKKIRNVNPSQREPFKIIVLGTVVTFSLIILFSFIVATVYTNPRFVPFGSLFFFPFIALTAYAILRHKLLNVRAVWAVVLVFMLAITSFSEVIVARDLNLILYRGAVFILILIFGTTLIREIMREVKQKDELAILDKELEAANERLKELDKVRSQFLSFASHQVKSPMTVVKWYASLIYDGTYGPVSDKIKDTAIKIRESADRLIALVNNLLDMRRIEEGKMEYRMEQADLTKLIGSIVDELKYIAERKGLTLSFEHTEEQMMVNVDVNKFRQVIQNVTDNAIKYTTQGWVKIRLEKKDGAILISISDSGQGIPQEIKEHLFRQYERGSAEAKKIEGTGLGLYLAKQIVTAHKGEIWADSPGEGKGSVFFIKLPVS